jgi:hypothetical protein
MGWRFLRSGIVQPGIILSFKFLGFNVVAQIF